MTGGSRPEETDYGSAWRFWRDGNGVSGHSFMSAFLFINAAKMTKNRWLRATFYAGSLLGPLSRVNDNAHYPSQAALGWWFAFVASSAIDTTASAHASLPVHPYFDGDAVGGMIQIRY